MVMVHNHPRLLPHPPEGDQRRQRHGTLGMVSPQSPPCRRIGRNRRRGD